MMLCKILLGFGLCLLVKIACVAGMKEKPDFVKESFSCLVDGVSKTYKIVGMIQDGETAMVLKALEEGTQNIHIVVKVARTADSEGKTVDGVRVLRNEWGAYKLAEEKYAELEAMPLAERPIKELPILANTFFLLDIDLFTTGETQLVMGMELLGEDLHATIKNGLETSSVMDYIQDALEYGRQIMVILAFLQYAGIIHRDIKPENFVHGPPGSPTAKQLRLIDFAFAHYKDSQLPIKFCGSWPYFSLRDAIALHEKKPPPTPCFKSDVQSFVYVEVAIAKGANFVLSTDDVKEIIRKKTNFEDALDEVLDYEYMNLKIILVNINNAAAVNPEKNFDFGPHFAIFDKLLST